MKIIILENVMLAFGGRQIELADGFLSFFKEQGHDAKMYSTQRYREVFSIDQLNTHFTSKNLSKDDFVWHTKGGTQVYYDNIAKENPDLIMTCSAYTNIVNQRHFKKIPIIHYIIATPNIQMLSNLNSSPNSIVWTTSHFNKKEIGLKNAIVTYPPYDFSLFRRGAKQWADRENDIVLATAIRKQKYGPVLLRSQLNYIDSVTKKLKLKTVGLFLARHHVEREIVKRLSFETHMNLSRREVAKFMGNSKIFFHPSPIECASVAIYEALNSGCYPIVRRAGSCVEQMGHVGIIYDGESQLRAGFWKWVRDDVLNTDYNVKWSIKQGKKFDREKVGRKIRKLLEAIQNEYKTPV